MGSCPGISTKLFYLIKTVNYMSAVTSLFKSVEVDLMAPCTVASNCALFIRVHYTALQCTVLCSGPVTY